MTLDKKELKTLLETLLKKFEEIEDTEEPPVKPEDKGKFDKLDKISRKILQKFE